MADQGGRRGAGRRQGEEGEGQSTGRKGEGRKEGEGETLYKKLLGVQTPDRPKAVINYSKHYPVVSDRFY